MIFMFVRFFLFLVILRGIDFNILNCVTKIKLDNEVLYILLYEFKI